MIRLKTEYLTSTLIMLMMIFAVNFSGCTDTTTNSTMTDNLTFSVTSSADSTGDSQSILILDTVKLLIKDIKLNTANNNQDSTNFKTGPYILYVNLNSSVNTISSAIIPSGSYDKIKFEVHKLNNDEEVPDPDFADANGRFSVVVKGRYSGSRFVYKSAKSAHQILSFQSNVTLSPESRLNITLLLRPYIWFIGNGEYLDPRNSENMNDIDNNIKNNINNNFKAFKDNDKNGLPD